MPSLPRDPSPNANLAPTARPVAQVSHELRTPLNAILGFCTLAQATTDAATREAALAQIAQAAALMRQLVDDLLDLEQLDAGRLPAPDEQPMDPAALMAQVIGLAAGLPTRGAVQLHARIEDDVPDQVAGDARRLTQILLNLLANALRHTDRGIVQLGLRLHRASASAPPVLRWSVADTGTGMALADLGRLARPFTQVGHDDRRQGGHGLGLALVEQLLARHGAALHWASVPDGGTLVWFDLPLSARAEPPAARPCTALLRTDDARLAATLQLRWRAAGQRLQSLAANAWPRLADVALGGITRWLIDDRLPEAEQAEAARAARCAGVALLRVRAEPAASGARADARGTARQHAALVDPPKAGLPTASDPMAITQRTLATAHARPDQATAATHTGPPCEAAPRTAHGSTAHGAPVLVVEDDPLGQRMSAALLQHLGLPCLVAGSLAEAARLARAQPPALVLMDRQLPDGDGLQWLAPPRPAEAPVVVTSAHADLAAMAQARQAGALAVLPKPMTLDGLRAVLAQAGLLPPAADRPHSVTRHPATPAPALPDLTPQFLQERPALVAPIEAAWAAGDARTLGRAVHALRGPLAWLAQPSARAAARLARQVEDGLQHGCAPRDLPVPDLLRQTWAVHAAV